MPTCVEIWMPVDTKAAAMAPAIAARLARSEEFRALPQARLHRKGNQVTCELGSTLWQTVAVNVCSRMRITQFNSPLVVVPPPQLDAGQVGL